MANDFVLIRCNLVRSAEVFKMAATLGTTPVHVVGALAVVWAWARDEIDAEGRVSVPPEVLDTVVGVPGLAPAMQEQGWLEVEGGAVRFPSPERWITRDAVRRAQSRVRADRSRARSRTNGAHDAHGSCAKSAPEREEEREGEEDNGCAVAAPPPDLSPDLRVEAGRRIARLSGIPVSQVPATLVSEVVAYTAGHASRKHEAASWPDDAGGPIDRLRMITAAFDVADAEARAKTPHGVAGFAIGVMESAINAGEYPEPRKAADTTNGRRRVAGW